MRFINVWFECDFTLIYVAFIVKTTVLLMIVIDKTLVANYIRIYKLFNNNRN